MIPRSFTPPAVGEVDGPPAVFDRRQYAGIGTLTGFTTGFLTGVFRPTDHLGTDRRLVCVQIEQSLSHSPHVSRPSSIAGHPRPPDGAIAFAGFRVPTCARAAGRVAAVGGEEAYEEGDARAGAVRIARGGAARLAQGFAVTLANVARPGKSRRYAGGCPCGVHHVSD